MNGTFINVVSGPSAGKTLPLRSDNTLGRGSGNTLAFNDYQEVSRTHARIFFHGGSWYVEDRGSKNKVKLNGAVIQRRRLNDGDVVQLGDLQFRFVEGMRGAQPPSTPNNQWTPYIVVILLACLIGVAYFVSQKGSTGSTSSAWEDSIAMVVVVTPTEASFGTAFSYQSPGLFVTDAHVVASAGPNGVVDLVTGAGTPKQRLTKAQIVTLSNELDLALLRLVDNSVSLPPLALGDSASLKGGDKLTAFGFPDNGIPLSVEKGSFPSVARMSAEVQKVEKDPVNGRAMFVQVGMQVTQGASGAPLLDDNGRVCGVIQKGIPGGPTVAISSDSLKRLMATQAATLPGNSG